jgi:hypothetical protein
MGVTGRMETSEEGPVRKNGETSEGGFACQLMTEDRYYGQTEHRRESNL